MKIRMAASLAILLLAAAPASAGGPIITTYAGGGSGPGIGDGGPATAATLLNPVAVAVDGAGNVFVGEGYYLGYLPCRIRKITPGGTITTFAGNGSTQASTAENVPATSVSVCPRGGLAVDGKGNLYVGEYRRVRRITPQGIIATVAGTTQGGHTGDGGKATLATFDAIADIALDAAGNLYIADGNYKVRKVDASGIVRTVAGNGNFVASGDGGPATLAGMEPKSLAVDRAGNLVIADRGNRNIRRVTADGIIRTLAGGHFRTDPIARNARQYYPTGIAFDAKDNLYVSNMANFVRVISAKGIQSNAIAGPFNDTTWDPWGAPGGFAGDGGPALEALLQEPEDVAVDKAGYIYVADLANHRVRRITPVPVPPVPLGAAAFEPSLERFVGSYASSVATGDVNGDGRMDAILTTSAWGYPGDEPANDWMLHAFLQRADGTLAPPVKRAMGFGRSSGGLAAADLNEDGRTDAIVTDQYGVHVYPGGTSGFGPGVVWPNVGTAKGAGAVSVADLDDDGNLDVLAYAYTNEDGSGTGTGLTLFYGDGRGGFSRRRLLSIEASWNKPLLFDATGDGHPDLVLPWNDHAGDDSGLMVYPHDTVDSFGAPYRLHVGERGFVNGRAVGDFDSDGRADIIVSRDGNAPDTALAYFRQVSPGVFTLARRWPTFDGASTLKAADMNADGRDDLLVLHQGWSSVGYWQQHERGGQWWLHGEVKYQQRQASQPSEDSLDVADLNGDGCLDVASIDYNYGLQVHLANCMHVRNGAPPLLPSIIQPPATSSGSTASGEARVEAPLEASATAPAATGVPRMAWLEPARSRVVRIADRLREGWNRLWTRRATSTAKRMPAPAFALFPMPLRHPAPACIAGEAWVAPRRSWANWPLRHGWASLR